MNQTYIGILRQFHRQKESLEVVYLDTYGVINPIWFPWYFEYLLPVYSVQILFLGLLGLYRTDAQHVICMFKRALYVIYKLSKKKFITFLLLIKNPE